MIDYSVFLVFSVPMCIYVLDYDVTDLNIMADKTIYKHMKGYFQSPRHLAIIPTKHSSPLSFAY